MRALIVLHYPYITKVDLSDVATIVATFTTHDSSIEEVVWNQHMDEAIISDDGMEIYLFVDQPDTVVDMYKLEDLTQLMLDDVVVDAHCGVIGDAQVTLKVLLLVDSKKHQMKGYTI